MQLYQPTITGSLSVSGSINLSGSITIAGGGTISGTASIATNAITASSADNFLVRNTLTAQTLVVQTITSSVDFVTGSTRFGSLAANTHTFTGSILSSGSIGIGVTTPIAPLHIYSNNQNVASTLATAYSNAKFRLETYNTSGQGISMGSIGGYQQYIQAQYSDQTTQAPLLLQPFSGSVGIGTSDTPTTPLLVYSNIVSTSNVISEFYNGDYTAGTRNFIRVRNGVTVGSTQSSYFGQGQDGKTYIISNDFSKNHIVINSANDNVGIGTNSPAVRLHAQGSSTGTLTAVTFFTDNSTNVNGLAIRCGTGRIDLLATFAGSAVATDLTFTPTTVGGAQNEAMRITSAGRVGIENTAPQGKLEVGNAAITSTYGGHVFSTFIIPVNTWYTVYTAPANSQWNAVTEFTWTSSADSNRSGAAYMRWAYEAGAATLGVVYTLFNNSQNATATFRKSGTSIQVNITGGAADYYVQVRIQGSQATT